MKNRLLFLALLISVNVSAQFQSKNTHLKSFLIKNDTVKIDSVSITPFNFKVYSNDNIEIDSTKYIINFAKALLIFNKNTSEEISKIKVQYTSYPNFLTKRYFILDKKIIVPKATNETKLYSIKSNNQKNPFTPFEGLKTTGNIARGLTIGNNQNAVVNSTLDLQLEGKLSDKVTLKASIIDTNIPIQENGNTYKLNEFDRVFIELFSNNWSVNAGDIYLNNNETSFLNFNKKVSGLAVKTKLKNDNSEIDLETSGAIVKGKYKKIQFNGIEANQGPYKLSDFNSNTYILILSGTEQIYVNGRLLKRGENHDYIIDYNTAEIIFNTTFPITSDMRITAEYQFTDKVYTRFITYNNATFKTDRLTVSGYFYNENDLKNQSLEQDLSNNQKQILADAGNNIEEMITPSAIVDTYSEDKILYKKIVIGANEFFEYSPNQSEELFNVTFSYVGENNGDYVLKDVIATGKIYEFIGKNLGNYNPVIQLKAPNKLQIIAFKTSFNPTNKTSIKAETAFSNRDENLFSTKDDSSNKGLAAKLRWDQNILQGKWNLNSKFKYDLIDENFKSIERIQSVEFNRNWNLNIANGDQKLLSSSLELSNNKKSNLIYEFENLKFGKSFSGSKHSVISNINHNNLSITQNSSLLNNITPSEKSTFLKNYLSTKYNLSKNWIGFLIQNESNRRKDFNSDNILNTSHKFNSYEAFGGIGDSTSVYTQIGANFRITDSVQNNFLKQVSTSKTYYLKANFINSKSSNLSTYINYRTVDNISSKDEESLNSKILYKQQLFNQFLTINTQYQTLSGNLPQQDFSYFKTEPGQGFYTWIDYNKNGVKELNEFEIAQFQDQAEYLRIILPTVNYIATYQNKFTQNLILNPQQWNSKTGIKKILSHFYNQTFLLIDSKQKKEENKISLNPFRYNDNNLLGLNLNINNSFYFNKGKKQYSTTYNFLKSENKTTTTIDDLENQLILHQLKFEHKIGAFWQLNLDFKKGKNKSNSSNYTNRNYTLSNYTFFPKLSYYYNKNSYFSMYYEHKNKENTIGGLELLNQHKIGFSLNILNSSKSLIKSEINIFNNNFKGINNSPVSYQMLEGLRPGKNYTWSFLYTKKINTYLHLNINYLGRKSETSNTIHTGTIQLKALF